MQFNINSQEEKTAYDYVKIKDIKDIYSRSTQNGTASCVPL